MGASGETILIVEDAEAIRRLVAAILSQGGYECLEASNGAEALRVLESRPQVHLVLTDVVMPAMGGHELAIHLARSRPEMRIIFMSGFSDDPMARRLASTPLFLPKPFTAEVLMEKVRQTLDQPWNGVPNIPPRSGLR